MKIVYMAHSFPPTGYAAAVNTLRIVKGLVDKGHKLIVFCSRIASKHAAGLELQNENRPYPFDVYYSLPTPLPLSVVIPHLFNALKTLGRPYDLLITQFHLWHLTSFTGPPLKYIKGKPWVVKVHDMIPDPSLSTLVSEKGFVNSFHGLFIKTVYGSFIKNIGKKADKVFVLTSELQSLLLERGYSQDKVAVIPNGVDTEIFSPSVSKGNAVDKKTILYIGGMMPEDGLTSLVKAFALLNQERESHLTLIGDGPERLRLVELVKKLNLEKEVTFYRYIPHRLISEFIKRAYIGVGPLTLSPINYYTIPTKILEYFACGIPVVSAQVSKDILMDGFTGFVVKEVSAKNIAEKFSILMEDEKLTAEMGKKARQLVVERFEWERVIDQIEKEIQDLEPHRFS